MEVPNGALVFVLRAFDTRAPFLEMLAHLQVLKFTAAVAVFPHSDFLWLEGIIKVSEPVGCRFHELVAVLRKPVYMVSLSLLSKNKLSLT